MISSSDAIRELRVKSRRLFGGECKRPERAIAWRSELGGVATQEERTIDRPMTVEKFSMGGRAVILCDR